MLGLSLSSLEGVLVVSDMATKPHIRILVSKLCHQPWPIISSWLTTNAPYFDSKINRPFHGKVNEQIISGANSESIHRQIQSKKRPFLFLTCFLVTGVPESWHPERNWLNDRLCRRIPEVSPHLLCDSQLAGLREVRNSSSSHAMDNMGARLLLYWWKYYGLGSL